MTRRCFLTWVGHVNYCKMLVLVGTPFHARKKWWGYEVVLGEGNTKPAPNWWKQFLCSHMWVQSLFYDGREPHRYLQSPRKRMHSYVMNTCVKCEHQAPGGPP